MSDVTYRKMCHSDIPALVEMENLSHLGPDPDFGVVCVSQHAWGRGDLEGALEDHAVQKYVVLEGQVTVGYFLYGLHPHAIWIDRLLIHPNYRRSDFGRSVLYRLYQKAARSERRRTLKAWVREDDLPTCRWMARMGFKSRAVRRGWSDDLDAVEFFFTATRVLNPVG